MPIKKKITFNNPETGYKFVFIANPKDLVKYGLYEFVYGKEKLNENEEYDYYLEYVFDREFDKIYINGKAVFNYHPIKDDKKKIIYILSVEYPSETDYEKEILSILNLFFNTTKGRKIESYDEIEKKFKYVVAHYPVARGYFLKYNSI